MKIKLNKIKQCTTRNPHLFNGHFVMSVAFIALFNCLSCVNISENK